MSCPEIKKTHLFLSGELNSRQAKKFRKHVKACPFCRDEANFLKMAKKTIRNTADIPDETIRRHILHEAGRRITGQRTFGIQTLPWFRTLAWGMPALAAMIVAFLVLHPAGYNPSVNEDLMEWRDELFIETYNLSAEMDDLFSNRWVTVSTQDENESFWLDDLSLLSGEFNSIRNQIQNLFENMAGI
ncbi:MAG TPA: hypothetical protein ENN03_08450 [bacterium]|nr:hypothetical protein [bacterium]